MFLAKLIHSTSEAKESKPEISLARPCCERQPLIKQKISLRPKDLFLRDRHYNGVATVEPLTRWWRERHARPGSWRSFIYTGSRSRPVARRLVGSSTVEWHAAARFHIRIMVAS